MRENADARWDPVRVAGIAEAADGYDSCTDKTYVILMDEKASAEAITACFVDIAPRHTDLSHIPDLPDRGDRDAWGLVAMRLNFDTH